MVMHYHALPNGDAGFLHAYVETDTKYVYSTDLAFGSSRGDFYFGSSKNRCVITRTVAGRHDTWYCTYYVKGEYYASAQSGNLSYEYIPTINTQFQLGNPVTGDGLYYRNAPALFVFEK